MPREQIASQSEVNGAGLSQEQHPLALLHLPSPGSPHCHPDGAESEQRWYYTVTLPVSVQARIITSERGRRRQRCRAMRPPLGGHVLQRASVDDGLQPYVSAQRGPNKH